MAEREAEPPERAELYDKPPADMYEPPLIPLIPLMPDATLMLDERAVDCWGKGWVTSKHNMHPTVREEEKVCSCKQQHELASTIPEP